MSICGQRFGAAMIVPPLGPLSAAIAACASAGSIASASESLLDA